MQKHNTIKIYLIDTHTLFRKGIRAILADYPDFEVIGDTSDLCEGELFLREHPVDLVLLDADLKHLEENEFILKFTQKDFSKFVVVLTLSQARQDFLNAIKSGVDGYLLKDEEIDYLVDSIKKIYAGRFIVSELLIGTLVDFVVQKNEFPKNKLLSGREVEVLKLMQIGYSNNQISEKLFLSENTIKTHIKHIYKKLSVSKRVEAIEKGILWGILDMGDNNIT